MRYIYIYELYICDIYVIYIYMIIYILHIHIHTHISFYISFIYTGTLHYNMIYFMMANDISRERNNINFFPPMSL